jgi:hypothetical protein
MPLLADQAG